MISPGETAARPSARSDAIFIHGWLANNDGDESMLNLNQRHEQTAQGALWFLHAQLQKCSDHLGSYRAQHPMNAYS